MSSPEDREDKFSRDLVAERNAWRTVALANQTTAQSHAARWAYAEAALLAIDSLSPYSTAEAWETAKQIAAEAVAHINEDT